MVTLTIQGSLLPYLYLVLWQFSIAALQHIGVVENSPVPSDAGFYTAAIRIIGNATSWISWILSIWVGHSHGVAAGVMFLVLGFASNALSVALLYRHPKLVLMAHVVSLPLMPAMAYLTLSSIGFGQA
jgi:hypothetical protein